MSVSEVASRQQSAGSCLSSAKCGRWQTSSMSSVLSSYGMNTPIESSCADDDDDDHVTRRKSSFKFDDNDEIKEKEKVEARKKYYLQIYEDMYNLRSMCKEDYQKKLQDKMKEQKITQNKKKNKKELPPIIKTNTKPRSEVILESEYLKDITKSEHYLIVELEKKLQKEGKLKTREDVHKFWCAAKKPEIYRKYFLVKDEENNETDVNYRRKKKKIDTTMVSAMSNPLAQVTAILRPTSLKPLDNLLGYWEQPNIKNIRRNAQKQRTPEKFLEPIKEKPTLKKIAAKKTINQLTKEATATMDRRNPKMEIPEMNCLFLHLEDKMEDPAVKVRNKTCEMHNKSRLLFARQLHRMYTLANSNMASSLRIMKSTENETLPMIDRVVNFKDMLPPPIKRSPEKEEALDKPWKVYMGKQRCSKIKEEVASDYTSTAFEFEDGDLETNSIVDMEDLGEMSLLDDNQSSCSTLDVANRAPLAWSDLENKYKMMKSNVAISHWMNYMSVNKEVSDANDPSISLFNTKSETTASSTEIHELTQEGSASNFEVSSAYPISFSGKLPNAKVDVVVKKTKTQAEAEREGGEGVGNITGRVTPEHRIDANKSPEQQASMSEELPNDKGQDEREE